MKQNNEESFCIHETNNCDKNNIVYSVECWFINVSFVFLLLLLFFFYFVLAVLFFFIIYIFFEFRSLGSQAHESQTRWPISTLACITPWHISHLFLVFLLLTLNKEMLAGVFFSTVINFEQIHTMFHIFVAGKSIVNIFQDHLRINCFTRGKVVNNGPSKIYGRHPLKNRSVTVCLIRPYLFRPFFSN